MTEHQPIHSFETVEFGHRFKYEGYELKQGWDENVRQQIPVKSLQPHIFDTTRNDAEVRFKDREALESWFERKQPVVYSMVAEDGDLAGIIWHRPEGFPINTNGNSPPGHTFAVRTYEGHQHLWRTFAFMDACLEDYIWQCLANGRLDDFGVWLSTGGGKRHVNFYKRYRYEQVGHNEKGEPVMVLSDCKIKEVALGVVSSAG